ncbi:hypothetical protein Bbelb_212660 [Branchiostoma belcheri]|nr:hypothetical protein Bbelb_212660 [Branchiostoma belcheri]
MAGFALTGMYSFWVEVTRTPVVLRLLIESGCSANDHDLPSRSGPNWDSNPKPLRPLCSIPATRKPGVFLDRVRAQPRFVCASKEKSRRTGPQVYRLSVWNAAKYTAICQLIPARTIDIFHETGGDDNSRTAHDEFPRVGRLAAPTDRQRTDARAQTNVDGSAGSSAPVLRVFACQACFAVRTVGEAKTLDGDGVTTSSPEGMPGGVNFDHTIKDGGHMWSVWKLGRSIRLAQP